MAWGQGSASGRDGGMRSDGAAEGRGGGRGAGALPATRAAHVRDRAG